MPLIVNSNIGSLKGINSVRKSSNRIAKTLEHISSGIRVNKAADDAGRIGSITLAESQVRGLQKSIQNLQDGLSLAQTLEGSLGQLELIAALTTARRAIGDRHVQHERSRYTPRRSEAAPWPS